MYIAGEPYREKLSHMVKHIKKKKKQGSCQDMLIKRCKLVKVAYFKKLSPIQMMSGIKFKNKDVVDFIDRPKFACCAE